MKVNHKEYSKIEHELRDYIDAHGFQTWDANFTPKGKQFYLEVHYAGGLMNPKLYVRLGCNEVIIEPIESNWYTQPYNLVEWVQDVMESIKK